MYYGASLFTSFNLLNSVCENVLYFDSHALLTINTPHNVGLVLWRLFSTLEVVQYIGG